MLKLKEGVDPGPKALEILIQVVHDCYARLGYDCVITSLYDGTHMTGSLHYQGRAADFRTRHVAKEHLADLLQEIRNNLGPLFDVVLEKDHAHVEFDPKNADRSKQTVAVI